MLDSLAMTENLVIVESPAKAKTIERYLGPGYTVLASYGHVRDLPENPGKGQLGVDVEHDFAPDYEISRGPAPAGLRDREGGPPGGPHLPRHGPRPRGRGDRLARRGGGAPSRRPNEPRHVQRDHGARHPGGLRGAAGDQRRPRRRPADAPDRRPARRLHAEPAHLAEGPLRPFGGPRPVGGGPARGGARTRDPGVRRPRVLDDRGDAPRAGRRRPSPPSSCGSRATSR